MKTYLVTGGAGFIGANFVKHLLASYPNNIRIVVLDLLTYAGNIHSLDGDLQHNRCEFIKGDIGNRFLTDFLFKHYDFDFVVNFAAESHVDRSIDNPQLFLQTNILGTQNLLDSARHAWTTGTDHAGYPLWKPGVRFHQVSTDEVYGTLGEQGAFSETTPLNPRSPYSASKAAADLIVQAYAQTYKMPISISRCSNNYGPYQFPEKLIPLCIQNLLEGKTLPLYGDGTNIRDWLYVTDHCQAIDAILHNGRNGEIYNIGGRNELQNLQIIRLIITTLRSILDEQPNYRQILTRKDRDPQGNIQTDWLNDSLISFVQDRLGHDKRYAIDPSKIETQLNWHPQTPLPLGLRQTILWYLTHRPWLTPLLPTP